MLDTQSSAKAMNTNMDLEHAVQLQLLRTLCDAVLNGVAPDAVDSLLDQLLAYSEAHFASEELLMRQKSYEDFEEHREDHGYMLEVLHGIAADHAAGRAALVAERVEDTLGFIRHHIETRDHKFALYLASGR